jgi:hypothetical protein
MGVYDSKFCTRYILTFFRSDLADARGGRRKEGIIIIIIPVELP